MTEIQQNQIVSMAEIAPAAVSERIRKIRIENPSQSDFLAQAIKYIEDLGTPVILPESMFEVTWDVVPVPEGSSAIAVAVSGNSLVQNASLEGKSHWNVFELFHVRESLLDARDLLPSRPVDGNVVRHVITTGPVELVHRPDDLLRGNSRRMAVLVTRYPIIVAQDTDSQVLLRGEKSKGGEASRRPYGC